jgi:nitric oxide reductase large subunit
VDASSPAGAGTLGSRQKADLPLSAAVRELFSGLRAGAADVADLVAAETQVALRLLVAIVISAVGAAVLGIFGVAGMVTALAAELIARGISVTLAIAAVALLCVAGSLSLLLLVRVLARRALFARTRRHFRGQH